MEQFRRTLHVPGHAQAVADTLFRGAPCLPRCRRPNAPRQNDRGCSSQSDHISRPQQRVEWTQQAGFFQSAVLVVAPMWQRGNRQACELATVSQAHPSWAVRTSPFAMERRAPAPLLCSPQPNHATDLRQSAHIHAHADTPRDRDSLRSAALQQPTSALSLSRRAWWC